LREVICLTLEGLAVDGRVFGGKRKDLSDFDVGNLDNSDFLFSSLNDKKINS